MDAASGGSSQQTVSWSACLGCATGFETADVERAGVAGGSISLMTAAAASLPVLI